MNCALVARFCCTVFVVALWLKCAGAQQAQAQQTAPKPSYWVKGATLIDGTGAAAQRGDLLVRDGRIAAIGEVDPELAGDARQIEAEGLLLVPGFVDVHAHGDPFTSARFENFLAQGVTTIALGLDGASPRLPEEAECFQQSQFGPNVVLFVGHATARSAAGCGLRTELDAAELQRFVGYIDAAMAAGAAGLSLGLEYDAGRAANLVELMACARPVAARGGLIACHLRSEDDASIDAALDELIAIGRGTEARVHVSHLKLVLGRGDERAAEVLKRLQSAREEGVAIGADLYPYTASYTGIDLLYPDWARPPQSYGQALAERRSELLAHLRARVMARNGPAATRLGSGKWAGKTLAEVAAELDRPFEEVLAEELPPGSASAAYFVMDESALLRFLRDPAVMIASDGGPTMSHPRGYGSQARALRWTLDGKSGIGLAEAVRKLSSLPAATLGLHERGVLRVGAHADLALIDPARVADRATYEDPRQLAGGVLLTWVNGEIAYEEGRAHTVFYGRWLRAPIDLQLRPRDGR